MGNRESSSNVTLVEDKLSKEVPQVNPNIAAIDFGTTSVSLAYTTVGNEDKDITTLKLDENQSTRVCNAVLFDRTKDGTVRVESFGDIARNKYSKLRITESSGLIYFERIKMLLKREEARTINRNTTLESFNGQHYYLVEVIAFILKYLKDQLIDHLSRTVKQFKTTDFDWVITVPAIWDARAKRMMREAAYMAGLLTESGGITSFTPVSSRPLPVPTETNSTKLTLALEPEAAALYSQKIVSKDNEDAGPKAAFEPPTRYMVIDIGGGTVDITVHIKRDGGIVVESIPTGNDWGGTKVNEAFSKLLQNIVSDPGFERFLQRPTDSINNKQASVLNDLLYVNFEDGKLFFGKGATQEVVVDLPSKFIERYEDSLKAGAEKIKGIDFEDEQLYISKDIVESKLFGPALDGIISCILSVIEKSQCEVNTFYLVGGFGGCKYVCEKVQTALQKFYRSKGYEGDCDVIVPVSPKLAVATGAVIWRKNPHVIKARRVDATYGIPVNVLFDPSKHDRHYRYYDDDDKRDRCHSFFEAYVKKGHFVKVNEIIKKSVFPLRQSDTKVIIDIYSTTEDDVQYVRDKYGKETVTKVGQLVIDTPNPKNLPIDDLEIEVTMDFSSTEIQAKAKYLATGKEVKTMCDFLSAQ